MTFIIYAHRCLFLWKERLSVLDLHSEEDFFAPGASLETAFLLAVLGIIIFSLINYLSVHRRQVDFLVSALSAVPISQIPGFPWRAKNFPGYPQSDISTPLIISIIKSQVHAHQQIPSLIYRSTHRYLSPPPSRLLPSSSNLSITDEKGCLIRWSDTASEITGLSADQVIGQPIWNIYLRLLPPADIHSQQQIMTLNQILRDVQKNGVSPWLQTPVRLSIQRPDLLRCIISVDFFAIPTSLGYQMAFIIQLTHKLNEKNMKTKEDASIYRELFRRSSVALIEADLFPVISYFEVLRLQGIDDFNEYFHTNIEVAQRVIHQIRLLDINPAAYQLFGLSDRKTFINFFLKQVSASPLEFLPEFVQLAEGKLPFKGNKIIRFKGHKQSEIKVEWLVPSGYRENYSKIIFRIQTKRSRDAEQKGESSYQTIFKESPLAIIELNGSSIRAYLDRLENQGVVNLAAYLDTHPDDLRSGFPYPRILDFNQAARKIIGVRTIKDMVNTLESVLDDQLLELRRTILISLSRGITKIDLQLTLELPRKPVKHLYLQWRVLPGYEQDLARVLLIGTDISNRVINQQALIRNTNRLKALFDVNQAILRIKEPHNVAASALDHLCQLVPCDRIDILQLEPGNPTPQVLATSSRESSALTSPIDTFGGKYPEVTESLIRGDVYLNNYVRIDDRNEKDVVSLISAPLIDQGHLFGAVNLISQSPYHFSTSDVEIVREIATSLAVALENARLLDVERTAHQQMKNMAGYLEDAREEERTRIAREIHDELGQNLTALKIELAWLVQHLPANSPEISSKTFSILSLIDDTIFQVQRIAAELHPGILDQLGLVAAIEWHSQEVAHRTSIPIHLDLPEEDLKLEPPQNTALFRIFQEALTNVLRHAQATLIWIALWVDGNDVKMTIRDNGKGIREAQISQPDAFGLIGMRERAVLCGGKLTIQAASGGGTLIAASIPIHQAQQKD